MLLSRREVEFDVVPDVLDCPAASDCGIDELEPTPWLLSTELDPLTEEPAAPPSLLLLPVPAAGFVVELCEDEPFTLL